MTAKELRKRRVNLLRNLARMADGRHDIKVPLDCIAPSLDIKGFGGGPRFADRENPRYEGGSDLAYDCNTLEEQGLIKQVYLHYDRGSSGERIGRTPGITVTPKGFDVLEDASKSWLSKAVEKQPMTFVQIIVTLVIAVLTGIGGWAIGRYLTPANKDLGQTPSLERAEE